VKKQYGAESELDDAKEDLHKQELTVRKRELVLENYENVLAKLNAQLLKNNALLGRAELDLKRTQIYAPFNGRVAKLRVSVGNRVMTGDRLIDVFDDEAIEVRAQIPAQYVAAISTALNQGEKILATTQMSGQTIDLICDRLSAQVSEGRTGVEALFRVVKGGEYMPLGRTVELIVDLPAINDVVALPTSALYGLDRVYVVENDRLQMVQVDRVGTIIEKGKREVLVKSADLTDGDQVITTQLPNAITGLKVQVSRE